MNRVLQNSVWNLRFAVRQLRKSPGFTLTAVMTLAVGIGALTTVATWTNAVFCNPWPHVAAPRALRFIDATVLGNDGYSVDYDQYRFLREQGAEYKDSAAFAVNLVNLTSPGKQPQALSAGTVSSNYFQLLGLQPQVGRFFQPGANDRDYGANDEVVLSNALWRGRFGGDPKVVGRTVTVNGRPFTVAGVATAGFAGIFGGIEEFVWLPLSSLRDLSADGPPDPLHGNNYGLQIVVRLHPGVSDAVAAAELHTLARRFASQQHDSNYAGWNLNLRDSAHFQRGLFGVVGEQLPILIGASILLMLLVCINIASLLGQHAARRRREVAIRTTLGATPGIIAAQVLTETGLLAAIGTLAGWGASTVMSKALYVLLPNYGFPLSFNLQSDARILIFVAGIAALVTVACGMYPVHQSLRVSQSEALHEGGAAVAGGSRNRLGQRILLGLQLGICFVVLVCCGLLTRTALKIFNLDTGFNQANCVTASIDLSRAGYNSERGLAFQKALLDRLRTEPGVIGATLTSHLPMGDMGSGNTRNFQIPGYVPTKAEEMAVVTDSEGPDFFRIMRIPLQQGRDFNVYDSVASPLVAIINDAMARRYWPKGDASGHSIVVGDKVRQIVGVVHNYTYSDPGLPVQDPVLYLPLAQDYTSLVFAAIRTQVPTSGAVTQLRYMIGQLDGTLPIENVETLEAVASTRYQMSRIPAELLGVYALSCLLVAMMGLYAVMAYSVIERYREFALRIALGSSRAGIFRIVLSGIGVTAAIGLVTGTLGSIAAVRILRSMLFGISPFDPVSYFAAAGFLLFTVFASSMTPARRAASIEPMQALRSE
jgi:predicted permease